MENRTVKKGAKLFDELKYRFRREGIETGETKEGNLPIILDGQEVGSITAQSDARLSKELLERSDISDLYFKVEGPLTEVRTYMMKMEQAAPLKAESLNAPYKLLAEFNGCVLGGVESQYGVQFTTWQSTYDGTGLVHEHYHFLAPE